MAKVKPAADIEHIGWPRKVFASIRLLKESGPAMVGAVLVLFWVVLAIFANVLAPFDPNTPLVPFSTPGAEVAGIGTFWLGTDQLGRDILSRIIWGSRTVLIYAPLATISAYIVGVPMGLMAGYKGGRIDDVLSFIANVILSFPVLVLFILIISIFGASAFNIVLAITFASAPGIMRIVRGLTYDLRNREYVLAARTRGEPLWWVLFVEILPNVRSPLIVDFMLRMGYTIITIGVLGFLGLGLPPPDPDWGGMINETRQLAIAFPYMTLFPCIAVASLVLGFNLLADGIREITLRD